ncbi:DUF4232 domain-containing protein [Nocardioides sp. Iso805N]|uniref:DUF4232 domain-containing protein n=1 Tax=Nocardioides sp. Iso805N TaxID=1283287 RepID=UPI0003814C35|nr:DUF4232 domain-containing protein [Nocardioides sp. Iso805N]
MTENPGHRDEIGQALRWRVAGVAAAVLLVAGGISVAVGVLAHGADRSLPLSAPTSSTSVTGATTPAGAVPWKALPTTDPTPAKTAPASPDPAAAEGVQACISGDLHAEISKIAGAMGTAYRHLTLTLRGTSPCRIEGYPTIQLMSHGHPLDLPLMHEAGGMPFGRAEPVLVAPDEPAVITIAWAVSHSCPVVDNDALRVTLPGTTSVLSFSGFGTSSCDTTETSPAPLMVGPVHPPTPVRHTESRRTTA